MKVEKKRIFLPVEPNGTPELHSFLLLVVKRSLQLRISLVFSKGYTNTCRKRATTVKNTWKSYHLSGQGLHEWQ
jgi:hypothetical protein